jgi:hypothetical protein
VVKWLRWLLDDIDLVDVAKEGWTDAYHEIEHGIQTAANERGFGKVDFG